MIRICKVGPMLSTPFDEADVAAQAFFREQGLEFVQPGQRCDLFLADSLPPEWYSRGNQLRMLLRYPGKAKLLLWTNEPRYSDHTVTQLRWSRFQPPMHIMNIFTGDVYVNNYYSLWPISGLLPHKSLAECPLPGQARMVGMMTYVQAGPWMIHGVDRDLNHLRIALLEEGHRRGRMDVFGHGWPAGISKEDSRSGNWAERKMTALDDYDICLAMENTTFGHYCTEKIWQAIVGGCLPIYYGRGNDVYETFPKESFLDAADFPDMPSLLDYIDQMPQQEFMERYNRCIDVSNRVWEQVDYLAETRASWEHVLQRIRQIAG